MGLLVFLGSAILFLLFQSASIFGGDSGDLVTAAITFGVAHPPGYPLYTFLGFLFSHMPHISGAWGVTLLSSLPHAVTVTLLYATVVLLTGNIFAGLFAAVVVSGNYLFFLYSVTPEVFALLDFFVISLLYLAVKFVKTKKISYWYWGAFIFGLSLAHHHMILFFVPAVAYLLWVNKKIFLKKIGWIKTILCFFAGLIPYAYVLVASHSSSMIIWDKPDTVARFIRLLTRADYGTFQSTPAAGGLVLQRVIAIQSYFQFVYLDFTWIGVVLALIGIWFLWKRSRQVLYTLLLGIAFLGPLFFFYASFPFINRFTVGTYERFLLPSYLLIAVLVGTGIVEIKNYLLKKTKPIAVFGVLAVLSLYPLLTGAVTLWRFIGVPADKTAENLGVDILKSLPPDSIIILGRDTIVFSVQYARYAQKIRPDVAALHMSRMDLPEYQEMMKAHFANLIYPTADDNFTRAFLLANVKEHRIFSYMPIDMPGQAKYWIPYGLVYELKESPPPIDDVYATNIQLWENFHDPTAGILGRYPHLLLSDVRDVYAEAKLALGKPLLKSGKFDEAIKVFSDAVRLAADSTIPDAYSYLGLAQLMKKDCSAALVSFDNAKHASIVPDVYLTFYEGITYRDCVGDSSRGRKLFDQFDALRQSQQLPLKGL